MVQEVHMRQKLRLFSMIATMKSVLTMKIVVLHVSGTKIGWTRCRPQRDDDASPMSTYRCMLRPTWMISALQHKSKYKSNSISNFFEKKKNQIFWFPCCSTREDLSVDVSITYVGLILTKLGRFFLGIRKLRVRTEFNFVKFEIVHISGFPCCSTRKHHSIDVSITNVGLILTKLRWFQLFVKSQNLNFKHFWKKKIIKFLGFHGVVLVKAFPLMY